MNQLREVLRQGAGIAKLLQGKLAKAAQNNGIKGLISLFTNG